MAAINFTRGIIAAAFLRLNRLRNVQTPTTNQSKTVVTTKESAADLKLIELLIEVKNDSKE